MSYSMQAYAIDSDRLAGLFGSQNRVLADSIASEHAERIAEHDGWFETEIRAGAPTLMQAVYDIIRGEGSVASSSFQHVYALELLCDAIGDRLPADAFASSGVELLDEAGVADALIGAEVLPVPIVFPKGVPSVGFLTPEAVVEEYVKCADIDLDEVDPDIADAREQYADWLRVASERMCAIVTFFY